MCKTRFVSLSVGVLVLLSAVSVKANEVFWWVGTVGDAIQGRLEITDSAFSAGAFHYDPTGGDIAKLDLWRTDSFAFSLAPIPGAFAFIDGVLSSDKSTFSSFNLGWIPAEGAGIIGDAGFLAVFPPQVDPSLSLGSWVHAPGVKGVPESGTASAIFGMALLGLGLLRRRLTE